MSDSNNSELDRILKELDDWYRYMYGLSKIPPRTTKADGDIRDALMALIAKEVTAAREEARDIFHDARIEIAGVEHVIVMIPTNYAIDSPHYKRYTFDKDNRGVAYYTVSATPSDTIDAIFRKHDERFGPSSTPPTNETERTA